MKKEYAIKDQVWIHLGEKSLVEGRVVEVIDLTHLKEGHSADDELYIIEIKTGIENVYEVRPFDLISPNASGPLALFRNAEARRANRYFKKIGIDAPLGEDISFPAEDAAVVALAENTTTPKKRFYRKKKV
jgi:hypothetical protein